MKYCIVITRKHKDDNFCWHLMMVYGTTYVVDKVGFVSEIHEVMGGLSLPVLFWGGFNLTREAKDKSSGLVNNSWAFLFNDWINK